MFKVSWCGTDLQTPQVYLEQTTLVQLLLALLGLSWTIIFSKSFRSSCPEVLLRKVVLKICRKFTREHPCRSVISIKLLCNFIEIRLRNGCSPVNFLHIFRTSFLKNRSGQLLLIIDQCRFFYVGNRAWFSDEFAWRLHYIPSLGSVGFI